MKIQAVALSLALTLGAAPQSSAQHNSAQHNSAQAMPGMKMPATGAQTGTQKTPAVQVSGLYVAAVPSVATESAAYMTLKNTGKAPLILTGVSSPAAKTGMLMTMKRTGAGGNALDMTAMTMVTSFTLKPGQSLTFAPSGAHLMLSGLTKPLSVVGQTVPLTLTFKGGSVLKLSAPVKRF
jgi:periplasmic copper chaperone A